MHSRNCKACAIKHQAESVGTPLPSNSVCNPSRTCDFIFVFKIQGSVQNERQHENERKVVMRKDGSAGGPSAA